jgi:thiol-disulfide isomerase/thioredoxin
MRRRTAGIALTAFALAASLAGCTSDPGDASGLKGDGTAFVSGQGVQVMVPSARRGAPVSLSADTLAGDGLDLASLRGKPVVVNVWGSWCPPCRKEAPDLQAAAEKLHGKAAFVGINTRDSIGSAQAYERKFKVSYPSLVDKGTLLLAFQGQVAPSQIPTTLILDQQGRIAARFSGPVTQRTLVQAVADVSATS